MEPKEKNTADASTEKSPVENQKTPEQQKAERLERIDKELGSFNEKTKSPEEIKNIENERSQHYQQKVDQLENVLGPLGDESKRLVQKGLVKDVIEQANKENDRYDELQTDKAKLEGSEPIESSESDGLVRMMEYKLGTKLPVDREALFRNFDKYIPGKLENIIMLGNKENPSKRYTRESIKEQLEKDIWNENRKRALNYEPFDPEAELKKIAEFTKEEKGRTTAKERIEIKKSRLEKYKQSLAKQKIGIGMLNSELENMILGSKDVNWEELDKIILERAGDLRLTVKQLGKYSSILGEAKQRELIIEKFSQEYAGRDSEFFEEMFGRKPYGKISIKTSALSIAVVCEDERDYSWIDSGTYKYGGESTSAENETADSRPSFGHVVRNTKIVELGKCVTAINASLIAKEKFYNYKKELEGVISHEEKHVANELIEKEFPDFEGKSYALEKNEIRAKDEILSFLKDGSEIETIKSILFTSRDEGGFYDYFEKDKKNLQDGQEAYASHPGFETNPYMREMVGKIQEAIKKIDQEKKTFEEHISVALDAASKLEKIGFSRVEIIGLFQVERLSQWGKVYERIKKSEKFKEKKSTPISNLNEKIKEYEKSLEITRGEIKEVEEYWKNEKRRTGLSKFFRAMFRDPSESVLRKKNLERLKEQLKSAEQYLDKLLNQKDNLESL